MPDSPLVPVVDVSAWTDGDAAGRRALAEQVDRICRDVGFLQVVGHGVPATLVADMLEVTTAFFDLPLEEKCRYVPPRAEVNRGYAAVGTEALSYSLGADSPPDLFEAFNIGLDEWPADPASPASLAYFEAEAHRMFATNIWPDRPADMRPVWVSYYRAMAGLADRLMTVFAGALGLPEGFFTAKTDRSPDVMRANNYQRRPGTPDPAPGQLRMGAHTDYGTCTILLADDVPGLEILGPDGSWWPLRPEPGAFVVNLGDLLAEWTNDRWRSTLHRVVPPPRTVAGPARRRSVAFFHEANYDELVECLPTCVSSDNPPRYPPVTAGDHLMGKLLGPRTLSASTATSTAADRT